ncbi:GTPase IMAP family member 8 [Dissostichus eleginoides]|uniref:GTPase IMAP family member 8 n=1 Tax=Dissostichus eleginoides TaxID=100907 RepID=A0AAD9B4L9_DISEL|nr:GTPase IMAP family member 8 [Dissostichus eleginoides]
MQQVRVWAEALRGTCLDHQASPEGHTGAKRKRKRKHKSTQTSRRGDGRCTSHLKIILLGGRNSGKSSVGNLLLGKEEFVTRERTSCSRRLGVVAGRRLAVVDTPGWWCDFSAQDTSQLVKREIANSVSLCSPGPHVFLITIKASSSFSEKRRRAVEEHVALLGERVWSHCMVVFISAYRSEHTEFLRMGGEALRWLKEKRRAEVEAQKRFVRMKKHRSLMRERLRPVTDVRIVLVGAKGSGKTSTLNTILNREQPSAWWEEERFGRQVTVVDTPGWWRNYYSDESPVFDRRQLLLSLSLCPPGPHVFLLVIRVDRAFTETYRRAAQEHLQLISEHIWSRVIVLFTFGDWLGGTTTEQCIESEGEPLQWLVERCDNRQIAKSQLETLNPLHELRIVLLGSWKTGKSSCGDTILGRECFDTGTQTTSCSENRVKISGKTVAVLDTPGCFSVTSDLLEASCAILLVVNVSSSFNDTHMGAIEKQLESGGGQMWSRAAVLFSYGDWLGDTSIEQRIESEGEPLQRLVQMCGNRYHVLDNKHGGDRVQVHQLIELIDEMLVGERLTVLHGGDHMWKNVSVTLCKNDLEMLTCCRHQLSHDLTGPANPSPQTSLNCSGSGGQVVAVPAGRRRRQTGPSMLDREGFMSCLSSMFSSMRWKIIIPHLFPTDDLHLNSERPVFTTSHPTMLLVLPQTQHRVLDEEHAIGVQSLCRPALRERTLRRLTESGDLQALIDQWGDSSLQELEAFIDLYFEMIWQQTMGSFQEPHCPTAEEDPAVQEEAGQQEVLSSIDRKLSKLELLEEIRRDLAELRKSLEHSWEAIQELREKGKQDDHNNTC